MSKNFTKALFPRLPAIIRVFGTPFHIYDADGIIEGGKHLNASFEEVNELSGFREFYAVKALPNPTTLQLLHERLGFGFDCSSTMEIELAMKAGAKQGDIMFTSNNSTVAQFVTALEAGAIVNLDDISLIDTLATASKAASVSMPFPRTVCFRLNPGRLRSGNAIIGKPHEAKYGLTWEQIIPAYAQAQALGAERFGLHTMICSNQRGAEYHVHTVKMLLRLAAQLQKELGIVLQFINMGGGIGIPYQPRHRRIDLRQLALSIHETMRDFQAVHGWVPRLAMESGRYITGPHGALVARVINIKDIYEKHVGVDTGMPALMRPAMYGAYHHITVLDPRGRPKTGPKEKVNIVGSICENCDRLATQRLLPRIDVGDIIVTHDTGAHGSAMGFNYNGQLRPQELMISRRIAVPAQEIGYKVTRIRRAETNADLWRMYSLPLQNLLVP